MFYVMALKMNIHAACRKEPSCRVSKPGVVRPAQPILPCQDTLSITLSTLTSWYYARGTLIPSREKGSHLLCSSGKTGRILVLSCFFYTNISK